MNANFVIMGLPASGKTTFLAALWHLVGADEVPCRLKLDRYEGDLTYLNLIAEAWRTFKKVPRTSQVGDVDVTIHLVDRETEVAGAAFFPDIAGETFDAQVEARRCRPDLVERIAGDDGILLFISADVKGDALSVVELNAMLPRDDAAAEAPKPAAAAAEVVAIESVETPVAPEWGPKLVPAQVRVVQLLSDLLRTPFEARRRRLAIMISAWDLTLGMEVDPRTWLATRMPLVNQFLLTNGSSFEHEVYGVSAQGVSLNDVAAVNRAARLAPSRRIRIVGPDAEGHDLTTPLVWLMSRD